MIPAHFEYHAPNELQQVFSMLQKFGPKAKIIAGGHSLLPMMKLRFAEPSHLIDINGIESLRGITLTDEYIEIGAMTTESQILTFPEMETLCPLLYKATGLIADPQVRNRGTIGGDIAHGDPGNDQPSVMLALDASFQLESAAGSRIVKADDFFLGTFLTALNKDELLTKILIPQIRAKQRWGFRKLKRKTGDFATAACAISLSFSEGQCSDVRIALTNLGPKSFCAQRAQWLLNNHPLTEETLEAAILLAMEACDPAVDQRGDKAYKTAMAGEMLKRALQDATV